MYLSLNQAAIKVGKSKTTVSRYIKNGKLSCIEKDDNGYKIDPAELFRVFPPVPEQNDESGHSDTPSSTPLLQQEIEFLKRELASKNETIEKLESDKEFFKSELSKTSNLLAGQREKPSEKPIEQRKKFLGIF